MRSHPGLGGGSELLSSWMKVWSFRTNRYELQPHRSSPWMEEENKRRVKASSHISLCLRIQSYKRWKPTWRSSNRFTRRPESSPSRRTSVSHRRRAACSSAKGKRRKWRICRRPFSSTGSRVSAILLASPSQAAQVKVSDRAAPLWTNGGMQELICVMQFGWCRPLKRLIFSADTSDDSSLSDVVALDDGEFTHLLLR